MSDSFDYFVDDLINHLKLCVSNSIRDSILLYVADRNVPRLIEGVIKYVAEIEAWASTDTTSFSAFEVARQQLYLKHSIFIEWYQKPDNFEGHNHTKISSHGHNTIMFDLTPNSTDPIQT